MQQQITTRQEQKKTPDTIAGAHKYYVRAQARDLTRTHTHTITHARTTKIYRRTSARAQVANGVFSMLVLAWLSRNTHTLTHIAHTKTARL